MNLEEKVRYIKEESEKNKLIIFVGAGVSKNSDLPDWGELIKVFVKRLNYPIKDGNNISSDEYLKIPQYFYNMHGDEKYKEIIREQLDHEKEPNRIHELIFELNPKHIITTNYDQLLENTVIVDRMLFDVVCKDKDLLDSEKSNYIIKMHGDIKDLDNIVLKENDYLNYSQNHILIETYIKSLLVNNTFLFIGYSLNDYNLKQIMSWVDYLAKGYENENGIDQSIKNRPKNFIIQEIDEKYNEFIEGYYEKNNIFIINPRDIDKEYADSISTKIKNEYGARLETTLSYINDYPYNIVDKFYYGCLRLDKLRRVSINDLFSIYRFKLYEILDGNTLYIKHIKSEEYESIKNIINNDSKKETLIRNTFIKAGIEYIIIRNDLQDEEYKLSRIDEDLNDDIKILNDLEIRCDYQGIEDHLENIRNQGIKAIYLYKLLQVEKAKECLENINKDILKDSMYDLLKFKYNLGLLKRLSYDNRPKEYDDFEHIYKNIVTKSMYEVNYLNDIFKGNYIQKLELDNLKVKHLNVFLKLDNSLTIEDVKRNLYKIKTIVYNYYFYIRENGILLDYFSNMKDFFEPYIESILSTYSPKTKRNRPDLIMGDINDYSPYKLNLYDWDIIIKYSYYKNIKGFLREYEVKEIEFEEEIDFITILSNLCKYIQEKHNRFYIGYLKKFLLLLKVINLEKDQVNNVIKILDNILIDDEENENLFILKEITEDIITFVTKYESIINKKYFEVVINQLFEKDMREKVKEDRIIFKFINCIVKYSDKLYAEKLNMIIQEKDYDFILSLNNLFTDKQKQLLAKNLSEDIDKVNVKIIVKFIYCGIIQYNKNMNIKLLKEAEDLLSFKKNNPNHIAPDFLSDFLDNIVILFLIYEDIDILKFKKYAQYNERLDFVINQNDFDYNKIEVDHYNWFNIIRNSRFIKIMPEKAKAIISQKLKYNIDNGFASDEQYELYYKYYNN